MASKSTEIDWDEVLLTQDPKKKEIAVSFKRVDGGGFFSTENGGGGNEPGTPPGAREDENGCTNTVELVSNDTFNYQSSYPHWVWLVFGGMPIEYMEVDIVFTDGTNMTFEGDAYTSQAITLEINPATFESDGSGLVGKKVPLLTGDLSDEIADGATGGNYNAEIVAVRGFSTGDNTPCFTPEPVTIEFGTEAISDPIPNPDGGPVPPPETPVECQPGNDCDSRFNRQEQSGVLYDSIFFLREGFAESTDLDNIVYLNQTDPINGTTRGSNFFELRDRDLNVIFDGNDDSTSPSMAGTESQFQLMDGNVLPDSVIKYNKPASPTNSGQTGYEDNSLSLERFAWDGLDSACSGEFFCAPKSQMLIDTFRLNRRRSGTVGTQWPVSCEVTDPANIASDDQWVNPSNPGAETSFVTWDSIFLVEPYTLVDGINVPLRTQIDPATDPNWPELRLTHGPVQWGFVHNGIFGGNRFSNTSYDGGASLIIDGAGNIQFRSSIGNGGTDFFENNYASLPNRNLSGWWTVKYEIYQSAAYKSTNESGDFGLYESGCTFLQQRFATWFYNGQQVTPRSLMSQFTRPDGYDTSTPALAQKETANWSESNKYFREGLPLDFSSAVLATYVTKPISYSSKWQPGFGGAGEDNIQLFVNQSDFSTLFGLSPSQKVPVAAQVDHSETGLGFFKSDQFKALIRTFDNNNPDYCQRIP